MTLCTYLHDYLLFMRIYSGKQKLSNSALTDNNFNGAGSNEGFNQKCRELAKEDNFGFEKFSLI